MATYAITCKGVVIETLDARNAKDALRLYAADKDLPGEPVSEGLGRAHLGVPGFGLLRAERHRTKEERVQDAERRARKARERGDKASAAAWMREARKRGKQP